MKKKTDAPLQALRREYKRLSEHLATIGYISQGTVLDRSTLRSPRAGYQWTRKVAKKTISVALSSEQYHSFKQAIANRRELDKTISKMEKLSRQILFHTLPDTNRRKRLSKRVLGLI